MPGIIRRGSKRPSSVLSDDEEQSEASSFVSVGSKRARHAWDASDSPAPTNSRRGYHGHSQAQTGHEEDEEYVEDEFQPGSIVRVKLVNFVTYTAAEFFPGPSLNMVIGPNGTGKSTLVCAICLGLGWSPEHLGRAKHIGEFVKHGNNEATIEIELAKKEGEESNPVIRRVIKKENNKSMFFINDVHRPQKDVVALAKSFSIQIDNLCQFLPQDRVVEFARLDPISLLRETQRAAAPESMVRQHDELKDLRVEEKSLQRKQQETDTHLRNLQNKQNATREDVNRWNERQDLVRQANALEKCRPILQTMLVKKEVNEVKESRRVARRELAQLNTDIEPARRAQREMEAYRDQIDQVAKSRKNRVDTAKVDADQLATKIEAQKQAIAGFDAEVNAEAAGKKTRKQELVRVDRDIAQLERARQESPVEYNRQSFEDQKAKIRSQMSAAERRIMELGSGMVALRNQAHQLRDKREEAKRARDNLDTQSGKKAIMLSRLSKDTARGWQWIEENRHKLSLTGDVYGPPILTCSVTDDQYADAVESQLRESDWTAITCTNVADTKLISNQLLTKLRLHSITIRTAPKPLSYYREPATAEELQKFGFEGWIKDYMRGPEPVLAMLCENAAIHRSAYSSGPISDEQYRAVERSPITRWVAGSEVYQITRRREYGSLSSTSVRRVNKAKFFTNDSVDDEEKKKLDDKIKEFEHDAEELKETHKRLRDEQAELKNELEQSKEQRIRIQAEQDALAKAVAEWEALPRKIAQRQTDRSALLETSADTSNRIRAIKIKSEEASLKMASLTLSYTKAIAQMRISFESFVEADIRLAEANSEVKAFEGDNAQIIRAIKDKQAEIQQLDERYETLRTRYTHLRNEAQRQIDALDEEEKELVKQYQHLSTMDELNNEVGAVNARLDMMAEGNPNAIRAYEKRETEIHSTQEKLDRIVVDLQITQDRITQIRQIWEPELDSLVAKISDGFAHNFEKIRCAGQVGVYKDDDFENWSIQIQVKFRENESLSILDSHRQSGGERAVSTIFYLMALQDLARSPFRVVDEINQGMDPRNERMVHERMVDIACRERTSQYFLITPKLLNDLKFHPKMKVHCIASGEHMPDQHHNLNFQKLAEIALRVKSQAMEAA